MQLINVGLAYVHRCLFRLRFWFRALSWHPMAQVSRPHCGDAVITGFMSEALGIGRAGALSAHAFEAGGYQVIRDELRSYYPKLLSRRPASMPGAAGDLWFVHANAPECEIALYTHAFADWSQRYRIAYWAWETSLAPRAWAATARWFDEIWVPSAFVRDAVAAAFAMAGRGAYEAKLRIRPHPLAAPPQSNRLAIPDLLPPEWPADGVAVLATLDGRSGLDRKNPEGMIAAWRLAFPAPIPQATLILKFHHAPELRRLVGNWSGGRGDIVVIDRELSLAEMANLVAACDVYLSLHRAEGFGLPMAEAMLAGKPVIATDWSGNLEFMDSETAILVPYRLVPAPPYGPGVWATPDIEAAAAGLRRLIDAPALRRKIGSRARDKLEILVHTWKSMFE